MASWKETEGKVSGIGGPRGGWRMNRGVSKRPGKTELGIVAKSSRAERTHSVDLSRIPEKTKLHCSPQMEASVSWVTALISPFLLLPLLSGP